MLELDNLEAAVTMFEDRADLDFIDPSRLSRVINQLDGIRSKVVHRATLRGEHLLPGQSACTWVAFQCQMSKNSAADRLCIGAQLEKMPRVDTALSSGEIGLQAASVVCHLQERVEQAGGSIDEEEWVKVARASSIKTLSAEAASTWHGIDPSGFNAKVEEAHERRQLFISECGDMYRIDGWLELEAGAVIKAAVDSLARPLGAIDDRSPKQRRPTPSSRWQRGVRWRRRSACTRPSRASRAKSVHPLRSSETERRSRARPSSGWRVTGRSTEC
jgi:uncharacterized protein DUF222